MSNPANQIELLLTACSENPHLALQLLNQSDFTKEQLGDALSIACSDERTELALKLLELGATVESCEGGNVPLVSACLNGNVTLLTALLNGPIAVSQDQISDGLFQTCMQYHHAHDQIDLHRFEAVMIQLLRSEAANPDTLKAVRDRLPNGVNFPEMPSTASPLADEPIQSRKRNGFIQELTAHNEIHLSSDRSSRGRLKHGLISFLLNKLADHPNAPYMKNLNELCEIQINITDFKSSPFMTKNPKLKPLLAGKNSFSIDDALKFHRSLFRIGDTNSYTFFHKNDLAYDKLNLKFQVVKFLEDARAQMLNKKIPKRMQAATAKKLDDLNRLIETLKKQDMHIDIKKICHLKAEGQPDTLLQVLRRHRDGIKKTNVTSYKAFLKQFLSNVLSKQEIQELVKACDAERIAAHLK